MKKSTPITAQFRNSTITFKNKVEALNFVEWFSFHSAIATQALADQAQELNNLDIEKISMLMFLSRDMADIINSIFRQIGGDYE